MSHIEIIASGPGDDFFIDFDKNYLRYQILVMSLQINSSDAPCAKCVESGKAAFLRMQFLGAPSYEHKR